MRMDPYARFLRLVRKYFPQSQLLRAWTLSGGISAGMDTLELAYPDGRTAKVIVRRPGETTLAHNTQAAQDEFRLLQALHGRGLAVPEPYFLDSSGEVFPTPYLMMEFVEGRMEFPSNPPADFSRQLAENLVKIHRLGRANPNLSFLPRQPADFAANFGETPAECNASLEEDRIRAALATAWPLAQHNAPVLLHGDYWPGNVLWRDGRLAAIIDWEDACLGDPLIDLGISRLDLLWICGVEAMDTFTRQYLSLTAIDESNLPFWDLAAALRLVRLAGADLAGWAAFFHPYGRVDIRAESIREYFHGFVQRALEKLAERG